MSNYKVLSRQICYDSKVYDDLCNTLIQLVPHDDYEFYYFAYSPVRGLFTSPEDLDFAYTKPLVIWVAVDFLIGDREFDIFSGDTVPLGLLELEKICRKNTNSKFILLTEVCDLDKFITASNLHSVELVAYQLRHNNKYSYTHGYKTKEKLTKHWTTFVNGATWHRTAIISYLLQQNLDLTGYMHVSETLINKANQFDQIENFLTYTCTTEQWKMLNCGFQKLKNKNFLNFNIPSYFNFNGRNIKNYNQNLLPVYNTVKLEIVTGTLFGEPIRCFNEKEIQSIYGCNFLLWLNTPGMVSWFRELGFDMFDDVVNHRYSDILDPCQRIFLAINDNIHLLNGQTNLDVLWNDRQDRFVKNCQLLDNLSTKVDQKTITQFQKLL
jgi:hypothetical protein